MRIFQEYIQQLPNSRLQKWREVLYAFLIYYIIGTLCIVLISVTDSFVVKTLHHPSIRSSHLKLDEYIKTIGLYKSIFIITIEAPIIEELSFRLLLRPTRFNVSLSIAALILLLFDTIWYFSALPNYTIRLIVCIFLFFILYMIYNPLWIPTLKIAEHKLLIITSLCFGAIHLSNFTPIYKDLFYLYPIYFSPQIFLGFILGIIRLRNGFIWAIILHMLVNGSVTWYKLFL
ncbi:CPBP family intramembrane metalloprotease [Nostoc sp. CHAB 5834]|nr:CPBP family intramembrane metalloprotease [Nostoc sp. CHAB 5834]